MGWELFCVKLLGLWNTQEMSKSPQHVCVFEKIDSNAKCVWACACYSVFAAYLFSLVCMCSYCIGGMNCCSPVHTHTNKSQAAEAAVSQLYWYNTRVTYSCLLSTYSHPGQLKQFSCTTHVSQFKQLNISSSPVYQTNIER